MEDKYIVAQRANGKTTLHLIIVLGAIFSIIWDIPEAEARKIALQILIESEEDNSV